MKFDLCSLVGTSLIFIVLTLDFMYQPDGNIFAGFAIYNMGFTKRGSDHVFNGLASGFSISWLFSLLSDVHCT